MIESFFTPFDIQELPLPMKTPRVAAAFLKKNLAHFVYDTLRLLEKNPASLPDTQMILNGRTVAGLSVDDLLQVKYFGDAAKMLAKKIETADFTIDVDTICSLHALTAKEEALEWGVLRKRQVFVGNCEYIPPKPGSLPGLVAAAMDEIRKMENPVSTAFNAFAIFSKLQPFYDANKRTAMLFMNGILMKNGLYPLFIPSRLDADTNEAIRELYDNGETESLLDVFRKSVDIYYPDSIDYGERWKCAAVNEQHRMGM